MPIQSLGHAAATSLAVHGRETLRLAAPIVVSRAALLVMTAVDAAMSGWAGADDLAAFGLGIAPQLTIQMIAIGFLQAVPVLAAQAIGAGAQPQAGAVLRTGMFYAALLGVLAIVLSLAGEWFFRALGQPAGVVGAAAAVSFVFALGMPGMLLFVACNTFLEATGRPKTGMAIMILVALVDLPLNGVFVLGWGSLAEPAGAIGAAATSSVMRGAAFVLAFAVLVGWERRLGDPRRVVAALTGRSAPPYWRRMWRVGLPMGLAQGVESAAFSALVFLGGMISAEALAAHQASLTLLSLIYMSAVGIGAATAIRVGHAVGRGAPAEFRRAGLAGIALAGAVALPLALILRFAPETVAGLFGLEGAALALTRATIAVAGLVVVFDAMMGASLGALRGAGDVWVAFAIQAGAFWFSAVPLAALLGLELGLGAPGLIYGILSGVMISFVLLAWRFVAISKRSVRRL